MAESIPNSLVALAQADPSGVMSVDSIDMTSLLCTVDHHRRWLGRLKSNGKRVSVRQYGDKRVSGQAFRAFMLDACTLRRLDHRFIEPILGFTLTQPFIVVTKYYTKGTLYDFLRNPYQHCVPTHMTSIALCIAQAMRYLHSKGIIFRNLSTRTIAMNAVGLPVLTRFEKAAYGTSSVYNASLDSAAPEMIEKRVYNEKADVYSFGFILFEMFERRAVYESPGDIEAGTSPTFEYTPENVKQYLVRLWNADPNERPSFAEIFDDIASGRLEFPGTDRNQIRTLVSKINADETRREYEETPRPRWDVDVEKIKSDLAGQLGEGLPVEEDLPLISEANLAATERFLFRQADEFIDPNVEWDISGVPVGPEGIEDITHVDFERNWRWIALNEKKMENLETIFAIVLQQFEDREVLIPLRPLLVILKQLAVLIERLPSVLESATLRSVIWATPPINPLVFHLLMDLYVIIAQLKPPFISGDGTVLWELLTRYDPDGSLAIFQYYFMRYDSTYGDEILLLYYFVAPIYEKRNTFVVYIAILYELLKKRRSVLFVIPEFRGMLVHFTRSNDFLISSTSYKAIAHLMDNRFEFDFEAICLQLRNSPERRPYIYSILTRITKVPESIDLCDTLINLAKTEPRAWTALMNILDISNDNCLVVLNNNPNLLELNLPTLLETYRLIGLLIPRFPDRILAHPGLPNFLQRVLASSDPAMVVGISYFLSKMRVSEELFSALVANGFVNAYYHIMPQVQDPTILASCVTVTYQLAKVGCTEEMINYIEYIITFLRYSAVYLPYATGSIVRALVALSKHQAGAAKMRDLNITNHFAQIPQIVEYREYTEQILAALQNVAE